VSRRLASDNPGALEPALAIALSTHTSSVGASGEIHPLAVPEEAAATYRRLAHANPHTAYDDDLTRSP